MTHQPERSVPRRSYAAQQSPGKPGSGRAAGLSCAGVLALCILIALIAVVTVDG